MRISVLVPAYNCVATLRATLDSVLAQTQRGDEILVMDDGSTDGTRAVAQSYEPEVSVFWQANGGLARARNALIARASGDLITFLDSDDIWHPKYIETQSKLFEKYPHAVAFFTGHVNFSKGDTYEWQEDPFASTQSTELIPPTEFFRRYNAATGPFGCFSYCAVPMDVLKQLGSEPFKEQGAEDSYCCSLLSLLGSVVYCSTPLAAYRVRADSLSADHVWTFGVWVHTFEILQDRFKEVACPGLLRAFGMAFAAKRRCYAKLLMGVGKSKEARSQLRLSLQNSFALTSQGKSLAMLLLTYLPSQFQPAWPSRFRGVAHDAAVNGAQEAPSTR
jgi:glycosyltransferase involved in cell wall biosynthesis